MSTDKKISQLSSGAPAQAGDEYVVARSGANYKLTLTNIAASMPATTITSGNLTFSSTAQRITGDFSNATIANRLAFQNSVTNGNTVVTAIPNGTATIARYELCNNSDPTNSSVAQISANGSTGIEFAAAIKGTGTYLPMTFYTGGSERVRIDTSGNVGIGTASPACKLDINTGASTGTTDMIILGGLDNGSAKQTYGVVRMGIENNTAGAEQGNMDFQTVESGTIRNRIQINGSGYIAFSNGGTERMRIDSSGNVGIGGTANSAIRLDSVGTMPASSSAYNIAARGAASASTTSGFSAFYASPSTAASLSITNLWHFNADAASFGAGATVTNQIGFAVQSNFTAATNNYGFYSGIASGSNRWNFYAAGTAQNYFAGNTGVGQGTPGARLDVLADSGTIGRFINSSVVGVSIAAGNNTWTSLSDESVKTDLIPIADAVPKIASLRAVTGRFTSDDVGVSRAFLIAQDVQKVFPEAVNVVDKEKNLLGLAYTDVIPLLVKAVQELTARVAELEAK